VIDAARNRQVAMMRERLRALTDPRVPHGRKPKSVRLRAPPAPPVVGETEYKLLNASRTASGDQYYEYPPPSLCSVTHVRSHHTAKHRTQWAGWRLPALRPMPRFPGSSQVSVSSQHPRQCPL
jgi:hypothetical protein